MVNPWVLAVRPRTLPASIGPILLGSALAFSMQGFSLTIFLLCLVCALFLQIAVNLANDYFDAKSGVDSEKRLGPIRVVQSGLLTEQSVLTALTVSCVIAVISGLLIVSLSSLWLLGFGAVSLVAVFAYSAGPKPLASIGLGEITVFLFFGWLAVGGTYYAHTLTLNWMVVVYATIAGLMSAAIMLVNNIRDIITDREAGKSTLAVRLGNLTTRYVYCSVLILSILLHGLLVYQSGRVLFLPLLVVLPLVLRLCRLIFLRKGRELNSQLAETAMLGLIYAVMTSIVLCVL